MNDKKRIGVKDITFENCIKRANRLADNNSYSGTLLDNKDARRVVFLVNLIEKLREDSKG